MIVVIQQPNRLRQEKKHCFKNQYMRFGEILKTVKTTIPYREIDKTGPSTNTCLHCQALCQGWAVGDPQTLRGSCVRNDSTASGGSCVQQVRHGRLCGGGDRDPHPEIPSEAKETRPRNSVCRGLGHEEAWRHEGPGTRCSPSKLGPGTNEGRGSDPGSQIMK